VEAVQAAYPRGIYQFLGWSVDGTLLHGRAAITHDVVGAPDFFNFSPCDAQVDSRSTVTIAWNPVSGATGGYESSSSRMTPARRRLTPAEKDVALLLLKGWKGEPERPCITGGLFPGRPVTAVQRTRRPRLARTHSIAVIEVGAHRFSRELQGLLSFMANRCGITAGFAAPLVDWSDDATASEHGEHGNGEQLHFILLEKKWRR
jgi:hypothetical protein